MKYLSKIRHFVKNMWSLYSHVIESNFDHVMPRAGTIREELEKVKKSLNEFEEYLCYVEEEYQKFFESLPKTCADPPGDVQVKNHRLVVPEALSYSPEEEMPDKDFRDFVDEQSKRYGPFIL